VQGGEALIRSTGHRQPLRIVLAGVGRFGQLHANVLANLPNVQLAALALALQPEVLLLDEPCSALDPIASGVVEDLVASLRGELTVVIVTHNLAQARRIADAVAVFWSDDGCGRLVEHGRAVQIFQASSHAITQAYIAGVRG